jgi:hypothetical protein
LVIDNRGIEISVGLLLEQTLLQERGQIVRLRGQQGRRQEKYQNG